MKKFNQHLMTAAVALGIALIPSALSARGLASEVQIEMALEARVGALVSRFDPKSMVRVDVNFARISAPLPGTSLEVQNFAGSSEGGPLRDQEISSVKVSISTSKEDFPTWLKEEIARVLPTRSPKIEIQVWPADVVRDLAAVADGDLDSVMESFVSLQSAQSRKMPVYLGVGVIALLFASLGLGGFFAFAQRRRSLELSRLLESRLIPALQGLGQNNEGGGSSSRPTVVQATLTASPGAFRDSSGGSASSSQANDVEGLKFESLEALFADCYWCHQDSYASWLWGAMSQSQRQDLFTSKHVDKNYLKWIQLLPKERFEDHLDPIYLSPPPVHSLSQDDLARWVEQRPVGYHFLSPLRQRNLPISLKTRLTCAVERADEGVSVAKFPDRQSAKRVLPFLQQFGDLSFEDETTILHNPSFVPESMRPQLKSLVWLALRPLDHRQKILVEHSAEALAAAWVGAPEVLARLREALPERKREMLDGYLKVIEVNRKTSVYSKLVEMGLDPRTPHIDDKSEKNTRRAA